MLVVSQEFRIGSRTLPVLPYARAQRGIQTGERPGPPDRVSRQEYASDTARIRARGRFRSAMSGLRTCDYAHGRVVPLVPLAGEPPVRAAQPTAPAVGNAGS